MAESETNLAINVIPGLSDSYEVQGRGELQLGEYRNLAPPSKPSCNIMVTFDSTYSVNNAICIYRYMFTCPNMFLDFVLFRYLN